MSARVDLLPRTGDHGPKQFRFFPYLPDNFFRLFAGAAVIVVHDDSPLPQGSLLASKMSAITQDKRRSEFTRRLRSARSRKLRRPAAKIRPDLSPSVGPTSAQKTRLDIRQANIVLPIGAESYVMTAMAVDQDAP